MPVAVQPQVTDFDRVRANVANQSRTDQKTVAVIFHAAPVVVVKQASLDRIALANEVLAENVCDVDVLMARVEAVKATVRVLLQHREVGGVELNAIVVCRAKKAQAKIVVGKDKATKVRNEGLDPSAHGNEIVVCVDVPQFHFAKCFLKRDVCISAIG